MAQTISASSVLASQAATQVRAQSGAVPWYLWTAAASVTCAIVGGYWDISWHISIGRDQFLSPPHILIYLCGVLAAIWTSYLFLSVSARPAHPLRTSSVRVWGVHAPLGTFVAAWGGMAMLASAPFDDWWHNAYGLDVKIISPPHVLLMLGVLAVELGALLLLAGAHNRAAGTKRNRLSSLLLYMGALVLAMCMTFTLDYHFRPMLHSSAHYRAISYFAPAVLLASATVVRHPWACSIVAGIHLLYASAMIWILPLFAAEPKLGPVYQNVTHFIPLPFPPLVIAGAVALDLARKRMAGWKDGTRAVVLGGLFLAAYILAEWPFANFLQSTWARNPVFGSGYLGYYVHPNSSSARYVFRNLETTWQFWQGMGIALLSAMISARLGFAWGNWMQRVQR